MVENDSDENSVTNKGVNVRSETCPCPVGIHRYSESDSSISDPSRLKTISDLRNELRTHLDLMGPTTPDFSSSQNTSSDADNEDSAMSTFPPHNEQDQSKSETLKSSTCPTSDHNKDSSIMADVDSSSVTNNFDTIQDISSSDNMGAHICINPECMCMISYMNQTTIPIQPCMAFPNQFQPAPYKNKMTGKPTKMCEENSTPAKNSKVIFNDSKKRKIINWIKHRPLELMLKNKSSCNTCFNPYELYKLNISSKDADGGPPKRVIFDLVDGIPRPDTNSVATNTIRKSVEKVKVSPMNSPSTQRNRKYVYKELKNMKNEQITQGNSDQKQKNIYYDSNGDTRVDFYYFDHGNAHYFHTTDTPPVMMCEILAERTEKYTTKFWAEFFATIHIFFSFCISFILQLFKFLLYSIFRPLVVGLMQLGSDYFLKPFLTTLFNGCIQPKLIFLYNIATSVRDLMDPIAECFGYFCREIALLFRAIRLCTYKRNDECDCLRKKNEKCIC